MFTVATNEFLLFWITHDSSSWASVKTDRLRVELSFIAIIFLLHPNETKKNNKQAHTSRSQKCAPKNPLREL